MSGPFQHGEFWEAVFETAGGPIGVGAEVHVAGSHLVLEDLLVFPVDQPVLLVGTREVLRIFRHLQAEARTAGFQNLTVIYHRVGLSRSGTILSRTRRLV